MSLTNTDLRAIKSIVDTSVKTAVDELAIQTANGFAEVHDKIDGVESRLEQKIDKLSARFDVQETKLNNTIERVDTFEEKLKRLKSTTA